jgi:hypothetical protein
MDKVEVQVLKGRKIVTIYFSNLKEESEIIAVMKEAAPIIRNSPPNSLYTIADIKGMHFNNKIREIFSDFAKKNKPYVKATAISGASGPQGFMINVINRITDRNMKSFPTIDEAKEWLVSQN